jgi:hypothetical protein
MCEPRPCIVVSFSCPVMMGLTMRPTLLLYLRLGAAELIVLQQQFTLSDARCGVPPPPDYQSDEQREIHVLGRRLLFEYVTWVIMQEMRLLNWYSTTKTCFFCILLFILFVWRPQGCARCALDGGEGMSLSITDHRSSFDKVSVASSSILSSSLP